MDRLAALEIFVQVVDAGSFSAVELRALDAEAEFIDADIRDALRVDQRHQLATEKRGSRR